MVHRLQPQQPWWCIRGSAAHATGKIWHESPKFKGGNNSNSHTTRGYLFFFITHAITQPHLNDVCLSDQTDRYGPHTHYHFYRSFTTNTTTYLILIENLSCVLKPYVYYPDQPVGPSTQVWSWGHHLMWAFLIRPPLGAGQGPWGVSTFHSLNFPL